MKTLFTLVFLIWSAGTYAQVAINTEGALPDNSAMLDVKSTENGYWPTIVPTLHPLMRPIH